MSRPTVEAELAWEAGSRLRASTAGTEAVLDWEGKEAPSPVQSLVLSLAACMASDVVLIVQKGRFALAGLRVRIAAERAEKDPRRLLRVDVRFTAEGDLPLDRLERAVALSRETYCSVWHSLRADVELVTSCEVRPAPR